ncbi:MAG: hypothetical protein ACEPOW_12245 [Bacteroidales bacterium]
MKRILFTAIVSIFMLGACQVEKKDTKKELNQRITELSAGLNESKKEELDKAIQKITLFELKEAKDVSDYNLIILNTLKGKSVEDIIKDGKKGYYEYFKK